MTSSSLEIATAGPAEIFAVGEALAGWLRDGDLLLLHGDLGAGKTTLTKGIAKGLGIDVVVSSPSFSLVNEYDPIPSSSVTRLYHLDLYRLEGSDDLASIGFDDFTAPSDGVAVVEWPERAADALPDRFMLVEIEATSEEIRRLRFVPTPDDSWWHERMTNLRARVEAAGT